MPEVGGLVRQSFFSAHPGVAPPTGSGLWYPVAITQPIGKPYTVCPA